MKPRMDKEFPGYQRMNRFFQQARRRMNDMFHINF